MKTSQGIIITVLPVLALSCLSYTIAELERGTDEK